MQLVFEGGGVTTIYKHGAGFAQLVTYVVGRKSSPSLLRHDELLLSFALLF